MTVKELIDKLQECDPSDTVVYSTFEAMRNRDLYLFDEAGGPVDDSQYLDVDIVIPGRRNPKAYHRTLLAEIKDWHMDA